MGASGKYRSMAPLLPPRRSSMGQTDGQTDGRTPVPLVVVVTFFDKTLTTAKQQFGN